MKILKVLGKRGRITIPFEIRARHGISYNDVISFEESESGTIILKKEKICTGCNTKAVNNSASILDCIKELSEEDRKKLIAHLNDNYLGGR